MTFISYAQNFEDIMLWRALKHVEKGFYIDVGANDPVLDSVTLAFYERGWRGINIEPMRQYFDQLCAQRPEDINLPVAVSDTKGELTFFDIPDTGLSTVDVSIAQTHAAAGRKVTEQSVPVATLADICAAHVHGPIHFLKIDVEGLEAAVLRGMDFRKWQPWILVVEATRPQTQITNHEEWEPIVLAAGYHFSYFDGLNHYYVADSHPELIDAFKTPPNVFDDFILRLGHAFNYPVTEFQVRIHDAELNAYYADLRTQRAHARRDELEIQLAGAEKRADAEKARAEKRADAEKARAERAEADAREMELHLRNELAAVYASTSWKISAPIRWLGRKVIVSKAAIRLARTSPRTFTKSVILGLARRILSLVRHSSIALGLLRRIVRVAKRSPTCYKIAFAFRDRFPNHWQRVHNLLGPSRSLPPFNSAPTTALSHSSGWGNGNSLNSPFKTMLLQELQHRQNNKNGYK